MSYLNPDNNRGIDDAPADVATEQALLRELRATYVPYDEQRADTMLREATSARMLEVRRWNAPLAAAAAVVVIGGGAAAISASVAHGGATPAGSGPAGLPSSSRCPASTAPAAPRTSAARSSTQTAEPTVPATSPTTAPTPSGTAAPTSSPAPCVPEQNAASGSDDPSTSVTPTAPVSSPGSAAPSVALTAVPPSGGQAGPVTVEEPDIPAGEKFLLDGFQVTDTHLDSRITLEHRDSPGAGTTFVVSGEGSRADGSAAGFATMTYTHDDPLVVRMECADPGAACGATITFDGHFEQAG